MGLLDGRVAVVTGAGRGLGRAHALALAAAGAHVVVNDLGAALNGEDTADTPAESVVAEITAAGGSAIADTGSVSDWESAGSILAHAIEAFGRLDAVVNNAGITRDKVIASASEQDFDATIAVHLKGTYALTHHAATYWREQSKAGNPVSGRIINTVSGAGMFGNVGQSAYGAAKSGIIGITLATALELRRYGVTVNAISPLARTRMTAGLLAEVADGTFDPVAPENASGVVAYLASAESGWLTGQVLRIEGNRLIRMRQWTPDGAYTSRGEGALTADELVDGVPLLFGTMPTGVTSLNK
jgi:NAD(P)-dependent dehydrogenase (short-subunit alcohol dehydrogenase family)